MDAKVSDRQLRNRAHAVSKLLEPRPHIRLAFNYINYQDYKYQFLADNIRHPTQIFVLEQFILLGQVFAINHGKSWFFHSHSQLKRTLGLDAKTVKKVVDVLVKKRILRRKKAGRTGTYHYKIEYPALMRHYRSFLVPEILEDKAARSKAYSGRLHYFAYMTKFCRCLKNDPVSDKAQIEAVEPQEPRKLPERTAYSTEVKKFIKDEIDDEYEFDEDEDPDEYDSDDELPPSPSPTGRKSSIMPTTLDEKIAYLQSKSPYPSYDQAKKLIKDNERRSPFRRHE